MSWRCSHTRPGQLCWAAASGQAVPRRSPYDPLAPLRCSTARFGWCADMHSQLHHCSQRQTS
eukprot:scaffold3428_cov379-Prasinococcus_capsulatus_cf.AAC.19